MQESSEEKRGNRAFVALTLGAAFAVAVLAGWWIARDQGLDANLDSLMPG